MVSLAPVSALGSDPTPRHDYNQQLYGLDLDDDALALPVAFYPSAAGPVEGRELTEDAASHSLSFDQRRRPETFFTVMATAFFCPTRTTSRLPRVTPV